MHKKILSLICISGTFLIGLNQSRVSVVDAEWSTFNEGAAAYNANYTVPNMSFNLNGTEHNATCVVVFPDGSRQNGTNIRLNQPGIYEFIYSVNINGDVYSKSEYVTIDYPQFYVNNPDVSKIRYVDENDVKDFRNSTTPGVYVELANKDELTFTNPIKVSDLKGTLMLVQAYIVPSTYKNTDVSQFMFKLTDTTNDENYVICRYYSHTGDVNSYTSVHAKSSSQGSYIGVHQTDGARINDTFGTWSGVALDGNNDNKGYLDTYDDCKLSFGFDNETKTVFGTGFNKGNALDKIVDLDDVSYIQDPWGGFECDSVRLSILCGAYSSSTANFVITKFASASDEELKSNKFIDTDGPIITVNENENSYDDGLVNFKHPIPTASGYDFIAGNCDVDTSVYYNYFAGESSRIQFPISNNEFTPTIPGAYTIKYSCTDFIGNESIELRTIKVYDQLPEMVVTLSANKIESGFVGQTLQVSDDIEVSNYSGGFSVEKYYKVNNGEETKISTNLLLEKPGTYTIVYRITDFIGRTVDKSYSFDVVDSGNAYFEKELTLPKYCISGFAYDLPQMNYYKWENNTLIKKPVTYLVTDKNGVHEYEGGKRFTPVVEHNEDLINISALAGSQIITSTSIKTIVNNEGNGGYLNLLNYFITDNASKDFFDKNPGGSQQHSYESGIVFSPINQGSSEICFATAQLIHYFNINLKDFNNFPENSELSITLTDAINKDKSITVSLRYENNNMYLKNQDGNVTLISKTFNQTGNSFELSFNKNEFAIGNFKIPVKHFDSGLDFDSFDGNFCYVTLKTSTLSSTSSFVLERLNGGQFLYTTKQDKSAPTIFYESSGVGLFDYNSIYHYQPAYASDNLSPNVNFTLTVYDPNSEPVKDTNGNIIENVDPTKEFDLRLTEFGKYSFEFTARDSFSNSLNNKTTVTYNVVVSDNVKPTINITSKIQVKAKIGDVVAFPTFTVSDNATSNENLVIQKIILSPSGMYNHLYGSDNGLKVLYEGIYEFIIKVMDEAGNYETISFKCSVAK